VYGYSVSGEEAIIALQHGWSQLKPDQIRRSWNNLLWRRLHSFDENAKQWFLPFAPEGLVAPPADTPMQELFFSHSEGERKHLAELEEHWKRMFNFLPPHVLNPADGDANEVAADAELTGDSDNDEDEGDSDDDEEESDSGDDEDENKGLRLLCFEALERSGAIQRP
jgi:hypothetical protein